MAGGVGYLLGAHVGSSKGQALAKDVPVPDDEAKPSYVVEVRVAKDPELFDQSKEVFAEVDVAESTTQGDTDDWEGWFPDTEQAKRIDCRLLIDYTGSEGKRTNRIINVQRFVPYGDSVMVLARCELRKANRTFIVERMNSCALADTGEVVEDVGAYLYSLYKQSTYYTEDKLAEEYEDELLLLWYVSRLDGRMVKKEALVIASVFQELTGDERLDDGCIRRVVGLYNPLTVAVFQRVVGKLAKRNEEVRQKLLEGAQNILSCKKTIKASEQEVVDYIKARFEREGI